MTSWRDTSKPVAVAHQVPAASWPWLASTATARTTTLALESSNFSARPASKRLRRWRPIASWAWPTTAAPATTSTSAKRTCRWSAFWPRVEIVRCRESKRSPDGVVSELPRVRKYLVYAFVLRPVWLELLQQSLSADFKHTKLVKTCLQWKLSSVASPQGGFLITQYTLLIDRKEREERKSPAPTEIWTHNPLITRCASYHFNRFPATESKLIWPYSILNKCRISDHPLW